MLLKISRDNKNFINNDNKPSGVYYTFGQLGYLYNEQEHGKVKFEDKSYFYVFKNDINGFSIDYRDKLREFYLNNMMHGDYHVLTIKEITNELISGKWIVKRIVPYFGSKAHGKRDDFVEWINNKNDKIYIHGE